jgi:Zn ribbon nucleic-acid-binding protein
MNRLQFSKTLHLVKTPPVREYARTAVVTAHEDVVRAVLLERVADYLAVVRRLQPPTMTAVPAPREAAQHRAVAAGILRLMDEIRAERPPTVFEIAVQHHRQALTLARARVQCQATAHQHELSAWRPDQVSEAAACVRCGALAVVDLRTAQEALSPDLLCACEAQ